MDHVWKDPRNPNAQTMIAEDGRLFAMIMGVTSEIDTPVARICAREILQLKAALAEERLRIRRELLAAFNPYGLDSAAPIATAESFVDALNRIVPEEG